MDAYAIGAAIDKVYQDTKAQNDPIWIVIEPRMANVMRQWSVGFYRARTFRKGPYYDGPLSAPACSLVNR